MTNCKLLLAVVLLLAPIIGMGQQQPSQLPDAPLPQRDAGQTPIAPPTVRVAPPPPANTSATAPAETPGATSPAPPMPPVKQANGAPGNTDSREEAFKLVSTVNFVLVPVTVRNADGTLVSGLLGNDFSVLENGVRQNISYFTSDPFPLSTAVVIDTSMSDQALRRVQNSLPALIAAFSAFDEVSLITFGNTTKKVQDFTAASADMDMTFKKIRAQRGANPGPPVISGPMSPASVGTINSKPIDPGAPEIPVYQKESHVLNDAILAAAIDLARRDRAPHWQEMRVPPRKVIFVISEGRESGSRNSYSDVLKILLTNQIAVYAISVAPPGFRQADAKFHIPGLGRGDLLNKYASATGGLVFGEFSQQAISTAYSEVTNSARNQYTLGYTAKGSGGTLTYRSIEVIVRRPNVKVYAKDGYYPVASGTTPAPKTEPKP